MESAAPYFTNNIFYNGFSSSRETGKRSRPGTSNGNSERLNTSTTPAPKERKSSFGRRRSSSLTSPSKGKRRPSSSAAANGGQFVSDDTKPPPIPIPTLSAYTKLVKENEVAALSPTSPDSFSRMLSRNTPSSQSGFGNMAGVAPPSFPPHQGSVSGPSLPQESNIIYSHLQEIANKRISTLDYLRKAHDGRVYWFNTMLFDKPDLARMPYFDPRRLARRAANYLLLGLSLPTVIDLNSSTPLEFLRSLHILLTEFESFQQIHSETGTNASSLSRARLPQMFRRGPAGKGRRTSAAGDMSFYSEINGSGHSGGATQTPNSVISFGLGSEGNDLLPGEEYTHLLTPSLPFDPDFFETFATLCDMLIDCYSKLMSLLPSPRECTPTIAELFTKVDGKVRKIIIQGVVKEFEDTSRATLKQEVSNVGKVVLGGLM
ncbi:hypothetical protein PFICI_06006 [Pestalotiopsis fici W106-1]|uniref:Uncharacterized protein n=1 Tax=Pestalotiopsis fici (strain W106-1 / CGMCC3.15140) TaxID=1229662 RepID=W3X4S0_PESFW|nr:uncharacterized protein PFICI_06006 [Pestalotiopsis fici W106-1]ETS81004.1 hypothetical protein PFICI_06006 [Pestalotiopsis fici W106-1]